MIGSIIGTVGGVAGSIIGGSQARKAAQKAQAELDNQKRDNENLYNLRMNQDATQTATAQRALSQGRQMASDLISRSQGAQAMGGGTEASVAAQKQAAAAAQADAVAQVVAQGEAAKDAIEGRYMQQKDSLAKQQREIYNAQAQASTQAANQMMKAGTGLLASDLDSHLHQSKGMFESMFSKDSSVGTATATPAVSPAATPAVAPAASSQPDKYKPYER